MLNPLINIWVVVSRLTEVDIEMQSDMDFNSQFVQPNSVECTVLPVVYDGLFNFFLDEVVCPVQCKHTQGSFHHTLCILSLGFISEVGSFVLCSLPPYPTGDYSHITGASTVV